MRCQLADDGLPVAPLPVRQGEQHLLDGIALDQPRELVDPVDLESRDLLADQARRIVQEAQHFVVAGAPQGFEQRHAVASRAKDRNPGFVRRHPFAGAGAR